MTVIIKLTRIDLMEDIDKLCYLISCVRDGDAYSIIKCIPRTSVKWKILCKRLSCQTTKAEVESKFTVTIADFTTEKNNRVVKLPRNLSMVSEIQYVSPILLNKILNIWAGRTVGAFYWLRKIFSILIQLYNYIQFCLRLV